MLVRLVYYSQNRLSAEPPLMLQGLRDILSVSQRNNRPNDVSGFLICHKKWFVQVLEGDESDVDKTYARIVKDDRHSESVVSGVHRIGMRLFPDWAMGGTMHSVDAQDIYLAHGVGAELDPRRLSCATILSLADDLQAFEKAGRASVRKAG